MGDMASKHRHIQAGLCIQCGRPAVAGKLRCELCLAKDAALTKQRITKQRQRYRDEGRCTRCSAPLDDPSKALCINCRQRDLHL